MAFPRRTASSVPAIASTAAVLLATIASSAAPPEAVAKARAEFRQALVLQTGGDWAGALSLLRRVAEVATTPQVRFNIALCEEHLGRLTAALGDYGIAAASGTATGAGDVASAARARITEVQPRVPALRIIRGSGAGVARISLDGNELGDAALEKDIPVDPGPHEVEVRSPSGAAQAIALRLAEGEHKNVEATLPDEVAAPSATPLAQGPAVEVPASPGPPPGHRLIIPLVVGSVGLAGLAVGGVFGLLESGAVSDLNRACGPTRDACPASSKSQYDNARTYATVTNVTLAAGGASLLAAAVIFVASRPTATPAAPSPGMEILPGAPAAQAGASLLARF